MDEGSFFWKPLNTTYMEEENINFDFCTEWSHPETESEMTMDGDIY